MLILGPAVSPTMSSRAVSVMLDPALPSSLSTVTTSSSATFSCLPPQRTIAYTRDLSFVALSWRAPARRWSPRRLACTSGPAQRATPDRQGYQTAEHPRTAGSLAGCHAAPSSAREESGRTTGGAAGVSGAADACSASGATGAASAVDAAIASGAVGASGA